MKKIILLLSLLISFSIGTSAVIKKIKRKG